MSSKYQQLASCLRNDLPAIAKQGGKLPTEAELSAKFHMSRQTVRHALRLLTEEGLIESRQGSGSYVSTGASLSGVRQVAVITTFLDDYIFPKILHDVQNCFSQYGYTTTVFVTENKVSLEREILTKLLSMGISGILVETSKSALPTPNADLFAKLRKNGVPILFLHGIYNNLSGYPCILDDNLNGGYLLTRHLLEKGHRRIAGIFKSDDLQGPQRYHGMVTALCDEEIPIPDDHIFWYDTEDRRQLVDQKDHALLNDFLQNRIGNSTAVICYNDEIAHTLIKCLLEHHRSVPEDISVVSFDDSYYSQIGPVPITSLGHRSKRTGQIAAQMLLDMISGKNPRSITLEWELMERQSG